MIVLILLLVLAVAAAVETVVALRTDGYGRRLSLPRSHGWEQGSGSLS
ncbi:hypothetical protein [Naasia sp. SYSU D00948]|nr:hypothetical protein [Naasia sp. SYSU D00948]